MVIIFLYNFTPTGFFIYGARRADIIIIKTKSLKPQRGGIINLIYYIIHLNRYRTSFFLYKIYNHTDCKYF